DDLPPKLDDAIARALEPQLDDRCTTAEELRQTLDEIWNAGDGIADALELGKFVREVSREQRAKRQRLTEEIRASRQAEGSRPSGSVPASPRRRLSSGPVLVTDVEAHDSTVGDERARRVPDSQSDPHATR